MGEMSVLFTSVLHFHATYFQLPARYHLDIRAITARTGQPWMIYGNDLLAVMASKFTRDLLDLKRGSLSHSPSTYHLKGKSQSIWRYRVQDADPELDMSHFPASVRISLLFNSLEEALRYAEFMHQCILKYYFFLLSSLQFIEDCFDDLRYLRLNIRCKLHTPGDLLRLHTDDDHLSVPPQMLRYFQHLQQPHLVKR